MIGKVHDTAQRRHGSRSSFAWLTCALVALATLGFSSTAEAGLSLFDRGLRWVGRSVTTPVACIAPVNWMAQPLFTSPVPTGTAAYCKYTWTRLPLPPTASDIDQLILGSRADQMTEDVPAVAPQWTPQEEAFLEGLHDSLLERVGTSALLSAVSTVPVARVVVIDTAPDASHGQIAPSDGTRHGENLAHLIQDLVCLPPVQGQRTCAAEVTTVLAMPWVASGVTGSRGGRTGTLSDLATAIQRATNAWVAERETKPSTTPSRLILNLSLGWEDSAGFADCPLSASAIRRLPATAVRQALEEAARRGVLVFSAAGNQSGGTPQRTGLICPGNYQSMPHPLAPSTPLLYAVSGLDASDAPLLGTREGGLTGIAAYGFGGVAGPSTAPLPPALTGSSVSTAVVSAVAALALARRPSASNSEVARAIYDGGFPTHRTAATCPSGLPGCSMVRRADVCGALNAILPSSPIPCNSPGPVVVGSSPGLPAEVSALMNSITVPAMLALATSAGNDPHARKPSMQVRPWTFPQPISVTCPTCVVSSSAGATTPQLWLPSLGRELYAPTLVVFDDNNVRKDYALSTSALMPGQTYRFALPSPWPSIRAAYVSGLDQQESVSVMEQIFVHR